MKQEPFFKDPHTSKVKVAVTDIDGILRGKYISKDKFLSAKEKGFGFCSVVMGWDCQDVCYDNISYTGWHTGYPDALAKIDLDTMREIPWENKTPFFLADFVDDKNQGLASCSRSLLKKTLLDLEKLGFCALSGFEFEWFNFTETAHSLFEKNYQNPKPISPGMFGYSLIRSSERSAYFHDLMDMLAAFKVPLEGLHTETGPGVYEAAIACAPPLMAADRGVLFKAAVKEIANKHGILPTFMARWNKDLPGSSGHIHQSLLHLDSQKNAFYDEKAPHQMSETFCHYVAGILKLLPSLLPLFAPTVNSYKRLVEGFWAPTRANWGVDNRTAALRVIEGSHSSTRLEVRVGGADLNPYLALSACLAAGAYGIREKLPLNTDPIKGNAYESLAGEKLPSTLEEASLKMKEDKLAGEILGEDFVDHFVNTRLWEWRQHKEAVTDWELKRYFEII